MSCCLSPALFASGQLNVEFEGMYALRRVVRAYTGSCIRIRRTSDDAELDIGFDANGVVDIAAIAAFCGAATGHVRTWYDQTERSTGLGITLGVHQPIVFSPAAGGYLGLISFEGSEQFDWDYFQGTVGITSSPDLTVLSTGTIQQGVDNVIYETSLNAPANANSASWQLDDALLRYFVILYGATPASDQAQVEWDADGGTMKVRAIRIQRDAAVVADKADLFFSGVKQAKVASSSSGSTPAGNFGTPAQAIGARATGPTFGGGKGYRNLFIATSAMTDSEIAAYSTYLAGV